MTIVTRLDHAAPLVLDTHDLARRPGTQRTVERRVPAPDGLGVQMLGVPAGSDVAVDLRLEAVMEGVLVTGTATVHVSGECARCLVALSNELTVDLQELYLYADREPVDEEEAPRLDGNLIDLESALRDAVVPALPFSPRCTPDCPGLCAECGARLADDPQHAHAAAVDPRWEALRGLAGG